MGLTIQSTGLNTLKERFDVDLHSPDDVVIALAGNPNTGKSTVFNALTGLKQHTGNWPGKTVVNARGTFTHKSKNYVVIDLPGTYSLLSNSVEEEIARDFICFGKPHAVVVVADSTCLERNLNLVYQILEITNQVVLCVNLIDEAAKKGITVDCNALSRELGIPVIPTNAREGKGLDRLKDTLHTVSHKPITHSPVTIHYPPSIIQAIDELTPSVTDILGNSGLDPRWTALRLLDGDTTIIKTIEAYLGITLSDNETLMKEIHAMKENLIHEHGLDMNHFREQIVHSIIKKAEKTAASVVSTKENKRRDFDRKIDKVITSKLLGVPIMLLLLGLIFWITIIGANYPSGLLSKLFFNIEDQLTAFFNWAGSPDWLHGILVLGLFRTLGWVISVMLPPMAIFFPLFTLLEDLGYLPRIAFNLDYFFKKCCAHGKQALTMCMGFGCNAAGVTSCRIIDSPRERLIAIITNNFVPCNGRFPTLIALATIFIVGIGSRFSSVIGTLVILLTIILAVMITFGISRLLSKTLLKGMPSSFTLELPPYRKPQIGKVIVRSLIDRTLFVLGRAIVVAAPAGILIWVLQNIMFGDISILTHCANFLDPFASLIGLDGYILMAFILGFPANEIVIPILIMSYMSTGAMLELDSLSALKDLLVNNGWTWLTAVCTMLFSLNHFPCGTALLTIKKETKSTKWTILSFIIPTVTGILVCFIVAQGARLLGLV
ncbi:ferrous iron transport protein B [Vallitalea pronyensis]|uniref:Ferrous iron transport protein B n=1 Tax=Vallitalea pronyensis TaxID=1348613 RepID=A0A8J8MHP9_9FIRM|nr:ferrous iron transport protein B [Vallitalea pronyensis]QUI22022.1 ferrous iron transport protein B [Vallitalea pronyensis]